MNEWKGTEDKQTMVYNILHRKLRTEYQEPHYKSGVNSGAAKKLGVLVPLAAHIMFLLNDTNTILKRNHVG